MADSFFENGKSSRKDRVSGREAGRSGGKYSARELDLIDMSLEDEEDYEEFARAREVRESGRRGSSGRSSGSRALKASGSAGSGSSGGGAREAAARTGGGREGRPSPAEGRPGGEESRTKAVQNREAFGGKRGIRVPAGEDPGQDRKPKKRRGGILKVFLGILLALVLIAAIAGGFLFYRMRDVLSLQRIDSVDLEQKLRAGISNKVNNDEKMLGYQNIALFGVDSRTGDLLEGDNRSDTIMICSINEKTGEIRLVSVYRDTILEVEDGYYGKANGAYALGGPEQAINMLNRNLDMNILDFVTVGFEGLAHTIDALGGIEIEIDEEEREYLNQYVHDMHLELGTDDTPVEETGKVLVTGIQATAYSRIRYTAGDDFMRAQRQRTVLEKTLEKAKQASPATLVEVANSVVGDMATSLSSGELLALIMKASSMELAQTGGLPQEEYRGFGSSYEEGEFVLPLHLEDNVQWLHSFLFGEDSYILSEEAAERDEYIRNNFWAY